MNPRTRLDRLIAALRRTLSPARTDRDARAEIDALADLLATERRAEGADDASARRAALADIGGREQVLEAIRDDRPAAPLDRLRQDLRDGVRFLRRAPGPNAAIILTLALGIGATSATFSVVDGILLKPLDYPEANRLVAILHDRTGPVAPANFLDWQRAASGFAAMGAAEYWQPALGDVAEPERILALRVTPEVLPLVGVAPVLGRFARAGDDGAREIVIGDGLWRRAFGADPAIVGRAVRLDGEPYVVAGVMPPGFVFAPFWATRAEIWAPLDLRPRATSRNGRSLRVFGRLAPGTSLDQARAAVEAVTAGLESRFPGTNRGVTVTPVKALVVGETRPALLALAAAVLCVLLIACANVAHLLLIAAAARGREVAVRAALGAPRHRLVRQFLVESLALALAGGAGGVLLASGAVRLVRQMGAASLPRVQAIALDERALGFALAVSVATTLVFGIWPALTFARQAGTAALRSTDRGAGQGRTTGRARRLLAASEIALAFVLLAGGALLLRSFVTLRGVDAGWSPGGVASVVVSLAGTPEAAPERRLPVFTNVLERLRALPGVEAAGAINHLPIAGDIWGMPFVVRGRPEPAPGTAPSATYRLASPGYFDTMRLPIVRGRPFTDRDRSGAEEVVIVNEVLAERHFPGEDPLGQVIQVRRGPNPAWRTIVGVARNAVQQQLYEPPREEVYLPFSQAPDFADAGSASANHLTFVLRTSGAPAPILPAARRAVRDAAPAAAISDVLVMDDVVRRATAGAGFLFAVTGVFAALAMMLAAIGVYSVISYGVELRRREIGIRLALGATPRDVLARVLGEGLLVTGAGTLVGLGLALASTTLFSRLLFGVSPYDAAALASAAAGLLTAAAVACLLPARRASRIEPRAELR
jgi:putative ABC transport system permease protein